MAGLSAGRVRARSAICQRPGKGAGPVTPQGVVQRLPGLPVTRARVSADYRCCSLLRMRVVVRDSPDRTVMTDHMSNDRVSFSDPSPSLDPSAAFAELGRIKLADNDLHQVLSRVAELAKGCIPGAAEVSVTLVSGGIPATVTYTGSWPRHWMRSNTTWAMARAWMSSASATLANLFETRSVGSL